MQSLSSSRPCTAHFTGGNLLLLLLRCLLAKTQKYFILYYLKTATFSAVSCPFPVQGVSGWAKGWAVPAAECVQSSALRELGRCRSCFLRRPKGFLLYPADPGRAGRTQKYQLTLQFFKPSDFCLLAYKYYQVRCLNSCF